MKRSVMMIVSNGMPFIVPQLDNIYDIVDEIVIVEGTDRLWRQVIKSERSTDGTIEAILAYRDDLNKIKLIQTRARSKNHLQKIAAEACTGDAIYQVDVDEFLDRRLIDLAFNLCSRKELLSVGIPQIWHYKWDDAYLHANRDHGIREVPFRFYQNRWADGLYPSHIPWGCYRKVSDDSQVPSSRPSLDLTQYGHHYLSIYFWQLQNKMSYYSLRNKGVRSRERLDEYKLVRRSDIGSIRIKSYKNLPLRSSPTTPWRFDANFTPQRIKTV